MAGGRTGARWLGTAMLVAFLAGCGGGQSTDEQLDNLTPEQIYQRGEYALETERKPDSAIKYFSEVERLYPYSEWAKRALIMQAFSYHQDEQYEEARAAAQRYLDFYPDDEDAPYAQHLLALSYYDQIDEVGRDQGLTFQALQGMREVIEKYPDSDYAKSAMRESFDPAFDHLGGEGDDRALRPGARRPQWPRSASNPRGGGAAPDLRATRLRR